MPDFFGGEGVLLSGTLYLSNVSNMCFSLLQDLFRIADELKFRLLTRGRQVIN